jgi:hypothetical protein
VRLLDAEPLADCSCRDQCRATLEKSVLLMVKAVREGVKIRIEHVPINSERKGGGRMLHDRLHSLRSSSC